MRNYTGPPRSDRNPLWAMAPWNIACIAMSNVTQRSIAVRDDN